MQRTSIGASEVDEEVVVVERLELDLDVARLDLVQLAVLLARDEVAVVVRELELETDLVVEGLHRIRQCVPNDGRETHLDELELQHQMHSRPHLTL